MVAAYKNCKSYSDYGVVTFQADYGQSAHQSRVLTGFQSCLRAAQQAAICKGQQRRSPLRWQALVCTFSESGRLGNTSSRDALPAVDTPLDMLERRPSAKRLTMPSAMAGSSLQEMLLTYDDALKVL